MASLDEIRSRLSNVAENNQQGITQTSSNSLDNNFVIDEMRKRLSSAAVSSNNQIEKSREIKNEISQFVFEQPGGEQGLISDPLVGNPVTAFLTAGGLGAKSALSAGKTAFSVLRQAAAAGTTAVLAEPIAGKITEEAFGEQPSGLGLLFNAAVSALTEGGINKIINKISTSKVTRLSPQQIKTAFANDDFTDLGTKAVVKEIQKEPSLTELAKKTLTPPAKPRLTKETKPLLQLAKETVTPKKEDFLRSAEDLAFEKRTISKDIAPVPEKPIDQATKIPGKPLHPSKIATAASETIEEMETFGSKTSEGLKRSTLEIVETLFGDRKVTKQASGLIDSINLDKIKTDKDIDNLIADIGEDIRPLIEKNKAKFKTHDSIQDAAEQSGLTIDDIVKLGPKSRLSDEQLLAGRMLNAKSAQTAKDLAEQVRLDNSDENLINFRLHIERHKLLQAKVAGEASKRGSSLNALKIIADPDLVEAGNFNATLKSLGGRELNEEMVNRLARIPLDNFTAVNQFIKNIDNATITDKVFEFWIASLLSGPQTQIANATGNTLTILSKPLEQVLSVGADATISAFTGKPRNRFIGEVAASASGLSQGIKTGIKNFRYAWATELPTDAAIKLDVKTLQAISGKKGKFIRTPLRFLNATDEFFKAVNFSTELNTQAFRQATKKGLTGQAKIDEITKIIANPTKEIAESVRNEALKRTFQNDLSKTMTKFNQAITNAEGYNVLWKFVMPFRKTPINIAKFGLARTPLGFIDTAFRHISKNPDFKLKEGELSDRLGQALFGTMLGATAVSLTQDGTITGGGPSNKADRAAKFTAGWKPYSIKAGGQYWSYNRFEPIGSIVGMAADFAEGQKELSDKDLEALTERFIRSFGRNITSKTFNRGISELMSVMDDPERNAGKFVRGYAGSLIPSIVSTAAQAIDPIIREKRDVVSTAKSRIPILSKGVEPKKDVFGRDLTREGEGIGGAVERIFSPFKRSAITKDETDIEIERVKARLNLPRRSIGEEKLTDKQFNNMLEFSGGKAKENLDKLIKSNGFKKLTDDRKKDAIENRFRNIMRITRRKFLKNLLKDKKANQPTQ